jgi:hypothetical protein
LRSSAIDARECLVRYPDSFLSSFRETDPGLSTLPRQSPAMYKLNLEPNRIEEKGGANHVLNKGVSNLCCT